MAFEASKINDALASERSIFSKQNHDYNNYIKEFSCRGEHVRKLTYISVSRLGWRPICWHNFRIIGAAQNYIA